MKKKNSKKSLLLLLVLVLAISVGYAALTTTLRINGHATVKAQSWNIHFNNPSAATAGSVSGANVVTAPTLDTTAGGSGADAYDEKVDFSVILSNPGDFYEFTVPVQNEGTLRAEIENDDVFDITATEVINNTDGETVAAATYNDYFTYEVVWADDDQPVTGDTINGNTTRNIRVRVEYKTDLTAAQLPANDVRFDMTLKMKWVQAANQD